jgi:DNA-directed RNA polymerase subunit RPC12/RpoP
MIDLKINKWCWRCDDKYYNENDMESIEKTYKCVACAKEVALKKELVKLKKLPILK